MSAHRLPLTVFVSLCAFVVSLACGVGSAGAVVSQFGSLGEGAGQFSNAGGPAVDQASGDVYLYDSGNGRVDKFSAEGAFLLSWGWGVADGETQGLQNCTTTCFRATGSGSAAGQFSGIAGLAVDNDQLSASYGDVYVSEDGNHRVQKFSPLGVFLSMFGKEVNEDGSDLCLAGEKCRAGKGGKGSGEFETMRGAIAVDSSGDVFVGDHERVQEFSPEGVFMVAFPVSAEYPRSLAVDSIGDFYIVSTEGSSDVLFEYDSSGVFLRALDTEGRPLAVTTDPFGGVFVGNSTNILEYGPGGEELASFDRASAVEDGTGEDGFSGIAFGETIDRIYLPGSEVVRVLSPPAPGPLVESESVSEVEPSKAALDATVNPENDATSYRFEYGLTSSYGSTAPSPEGSLPANFNDEPVSVTVAKLTPGTTYHYRVVATDAKGHTTVGSDATFTTPTAVLIDSEYATNVASTSATIGGELNPLGVEATYRIEYDTSEYTSGGPPHGTILSEGSLGSGSGDVPISAHANDLLPSTLYHYRIVARDTREGIPYTVEGPDRTFLTQAVKNAFVLPDGRQWEQVSPVDKQGAALEMTPGGDVIQASASGDGISYVASAPTETEPEGNRELENVQLLSLRGVGGWSTRDIDTPNETIGGYSEAEGAEYRMFSSDLSLAMIEPSENTPLPPLPKDAEKTIYLRDDLNGEYEPLVTADNVVSGTKFGGEVNFLGATSDLAHVVLQSPVALTPEAVEQTERDQSLYEWSGGRLQLVSVLPNGEPGNQQGSANLGYRDTVVRHAISDDGSRVIWQGGSPQRLYLRDMARKETVQVDAAEGVKGAEAEIGGAQFATADKSGSRVFFTSKARLTTNSTASGLKEDLYVFEVTSGDGEPLAGKLTDLSVDHNAGESADVQGVIGASEDGTSIFFAANGLLGDAVGHGVAGSTYLYVESYDGVAKAWATPHLIAALSSADASTWGGAPGNELTRISSRVSPDGQFLAFMSSRSLTGYDNRDANSGMADEEVFLYDAGTGRVSCASCNPTGARPAGVLDQFLNTSTSPPLLVDPALDWNDRWLAATIPSWVNPHNQHSLYQSRYLSDSGRLFFDSQDALVPNDTNGTWDVYEFESEGVGSCTSGSPSFKAASGGCVDLISSGGSREESAFLDASETGDDVFFLTTAGLASQDGDGLFDVYDAHVCSAALPCLPVVPVSPPPCSTSDSCKPAPTPQPESLGAPASQTFSGAGNVAAAGAPKQVVKAKSLTRAQKLAKALKTCAKKRSKGRRYVCERLARRHYGTGAGAKKSTTNKSLPVRVGR